jgi:hypothetical protein
VLEKLTINREKCNTHKERDVRTGRRWKRNVPDCDNALMYCGVSRRTVIAGAVVSTCLRLSSEAGISGLNDECRHTFNGVDNQSGSPAT